MEKFMTKEIASGLALDTGELIPASDLNAQMTAPPVPTSATWGNWREPTTVAQRLGDVLQLLCGGKRPPDDVVLAWLDAEMGDIGLQHFCAQHGPAWAQGVGLIDLAMVAVAQPTDGVDHEHVAVEPQVELAHAVLANGLTAEETFATASCSGLTEQRPAAAYAALPDDFHSHKLAWRSALAAMKEAANNEANRSYWAHELRAFDRAYSELCGASHGQAYPTIEDLCTRIKAADDAAADREYMLDSDDCIAVLRGQWKGPMAMDKPERASHGQAPAEILTLQEVWDAAGGNPRIKPTRDDVLLALKTLDEVCDEAGRAMAPAKPSPAAQGDTERLDFLIEQDNCVVFEGVNGFCLCWIDEHDPQQSEYQTGTFPTARAAIDAARAAQEGK